MKNLGNLNATRLLIFGGCYSNLAATQAMRDVANQLKIEPQHVICTGDLVAYCGEPAQVVDLIRDWGIHVLMGNCEESLGFEKLDCGCGFEQTSVCSTLSIAWYQFASQQITADHRRWMKSLPRLIEFQFQSSRFSVVHGSVSSINQFIFPSTAAETKLTQIEQSDSDVVIGGHSGIPFGQTFADKVGDNTSKNRAWLNSGVIGMPANDGTVDGWYMLIESEDLGSQVSWHRLEYDVNASQKSTAEAGMVEYAQALTTGLWPSIDILPTLERSECGQRLSIEPLTLNKSSQ